jgi:murein DD-endopeptidase MepM/ murein hydrolase activator NlpD
MAEMFQWSVDFFHLQPGDNFTLVVKEKLIDGHRKGSGVIQAARFMQRGHDHYAFAFEQDGVRRYFDEYGNTVQRTFLAAPLEYTRISSGYSLARYHPILKIYTPHTAIDYAAPAGTPIFTVADGEILEAQYRGNNGNTIKIRHDDTYQTQYLHLSGFAPGIVPGAKVSQGQVIGYVGSTGLSTGPHLCYRVYKNGVQVNPLEEQLPQGDAPVKVALKEQNYLPFLLVREQMAMRLNPSYEPVLALNDKPQQEPLIGFLYW